MAREGKGERPLSHVGIAKGTLTFATTESFPDCSAPPGPNLSVALMNVPRVVSSHRIMRVSTSEAKHIKQVLTAIRLQALLLVPSE